MIVVHGRAVFRPGMSSVEIVVDAIDVESFM